MLHFIIWCYIILQIVSIIMNINRIGKAREPLTAESVGGAAVITGIALAAIVFVMYQ